jgi:hypothetical protein
MDLRNGRLSEMGEQGRSTGTQVQPISTIYSIFTLKNVTTPSLPLASQLARDLEAIQSSLANPPALLGSNLSHINMIEKLKRFLWGSSRR